MGVYVWQSYLLADCFQEWICYRRLSRKISIVTSCLTEEKAIDVFTYLKNVAAINPLGKEEEENGILLQIYESINFVDSGSAASCYLNPETHPLLQLNHGDLIYPFGCNVSQKKAVKNALNLR